VYTLAPPCFLSAFKFQSEGQEQQRVSPWVLGECIVYLTPKQREAYAAAWKEVDDQVNKAIPFIPSQTGNAAFKKPVDTFAKLLKTRSKSKCVLSKNRT